MSSIADLMARISTKISANPSIASNFNAIYRFVLTGDGGGTWRVNLKDAPGLSVGDGPSDCTLSLAASDFLDLISGKANGQQLFFSGKLRIEGDMSLALKLQHLADLAA
jgi:putative sterol carrier protein